MSEKARPPSFIISVSLLFTLTIGPALASDVSDGLKHYNQGNFEAARKAFQKALVTNKEDPRLHYCLANSLMRLRKVEEALREYHLCIHYGPGTIIAEQSEAAIGAYEQHAKPFDREKAAEGKQETELRREEEQRQQAAERIHKQAEMHAGLRTADSTGQRNSIMNSASADAKKIRDQGEEAANNSLVWRRRYRAWSQQNADAIRKQAKEDSDALLKRAQKQAENYDRDARERANRMSETENNLNSQMLHQIGSGRMRLVPTGTNLYIRNYQ
ncbi:MAG: tetratricopeptide repeat protein [Candidatus Melainabacteria bacterium]|nr:tetratricopeptide repeat protein [Candidatus Melainabacteria bacterium]